MGCITSSLPAITAPAKVPQVAHRHTCVRRAQPATVSMSRAAEIGRRSSEPPHPPSRLPAWIRRPPPSPRSPRASAATSTRAWPDRVLRRQARARGARLVVFPESALGGYLREPRVPGSRHGAAPLALDPDGPEIARLVRIAGDTVVCVGYTEAGPDGPAGPPRSA